MDYHNLVIFRCFFFFPTWMVKHSNRYCRQTSNYFLTKQKKKTELQFMLEKNQSTQQIIKDIITVGKSSFRRWPQTETQVSHGYGTCARQKTAEAVTYKVTSLTVNLLYHFQIHTKICTTKYRNRPQLIHTKSCTTNRPQLILQEDQAINLIWSKNHQDFIHS